MEHYNEAGWVNVGTGSDVSIKNLAEIVADAVGFKGDIKWDKSKPDGTPRKLLDISKMRNIGWSASIDLIDGISSVYDKYLNEHIEA